MMKTYSCYTCNKVFKNSRSLASHNYKFHSSTPSTPMSELHSFKDDDSVQSKDSPISQTQSKSKVLIDETLTELKNLMKNLERNVESQENKIRDLNSQVFLLDYRLKDITKSVNEIKPPQFYNYEADIQELQWDNKRHFGKISDIENKLEKIEKILEEDNEQSFDEMIRDILDIQSLLEGNDIETIKSRIPELKNAVIAISKVLIDSLSPDQEQLLNSITNATVAEAKDILNNNVSSLQNLFLSLPTENELKRLLGGEKYEFDDNESEVYEEDQSNIASDQESFENNTPTDDNFLSSGDDDDDDSSVTENSDVGEDN